MQIIPVVSLCITLVLFSLAEGARESVFYTDDPNNKSIYNKAMWFFTYVGFIAAIITALLYVVISGVFNEIHT